MKKFITGFLLGSILFGTSIYAATTYYYAANEVSYTPSDSTWNVTTVKAALDNLKSTSGTALTDLKNTNIAKAVSANGNTLSSVITTLGGIANKGSLTKTINPGGSVSIPAGYYSGGKITANSNQNSGTYTPSSHGTSLDMGANNTYRYVNTTNVWNQAVAAADGRVNTDSTNYKTGYNNGYNAAINKPINSSVTTSWTQPNNSSTTKDLSCTGGISYTVIVAARYGTGVSLSNVSGCTVTQLYNGRFDQGESQITSFAIYKVTGSGTVRAYAPGGIADGFVVKHYY